jgi:hypothetical protein
MRQTNEQKHDADEFFGQQFVPQPADKTLDEIVESAKQQLETYNQVNEQPMLCLSPIALKSTIRQACLEYAATLQRDKERLADLVNICEDALDSCWHHHGNSSANDKWHFDNDKVEAAKSAIAQSRKESK